LSGVVNDKQVRKEVDAEDVVGTYHQEVYFTLHKPEPGKKFALRSVELQVQAVVPLSGTVKGPEQTDQLALKQGAAAEVAREPVRLTVGVLIPARIRSEGRDVPLPGATFWLDAKGMPVRKVFEMQGLGMITLYSTTKEAALKEGVAPERLPDLGERVS